MTSGYKGNTFFLLIKIKKFITKRFQNKNCNNITSKLYEQLFFYQLSLNSENLKMRKNLGMEINIARKIINRSLSL